MDFGEEEVYDYGWVPFFTIDIYAFLHFHLILLADILLEIENLLHIDWKPIIKLKNFANSTGKLAFALMLPLYYCIWFYLLAFDGYTRLDIIVELLIVAEN